MGYWVAVKELNLMETIGSGLEFRVKYYIKHYGELINVPQ